MPAIEFLTLRIPSELKRLLEENAEEERKSLNTLGREILEQWFSPCEREPIESTQSRARKQVRGSSYAHHPRPAP